MTGHTYTPRRAAACAATALLLLAATACKTHLPTRPPPKPTPRPDTENLVTRHQVKDTTVVEAAQRIDSTVEATDLAEPVRAETDQIRAAVAAAPAREVADVAHAFSRLIDTQDRKIATLSHSLDREHQRAIREQTRWLYAAGVALLVAFGIAIIFGHLAGLSYGWPLAALGTACFGLAQTISHPYFVHGFTALCVIALAYGLYLSTTTHGKTRKKQTEAKILETLVPILDQAYEILDSPTQAALDRNIFNKLSHLFTPEQKATIHTIRAENAKRAHDAVKPTTHG